MSLDDLAAALEAHNLDSTGDKSEVAKRLENALYKYTMGDEGLIEAEVVVSQKPLPKCFPEVYEAPN